MKTPTQKQIDAEIKTLESYRTKIPPGTLTDERKQLPSASSLSIDVACPGRQNILRSLSPSDIVIDSEAAEWMERGTRIHHAQLTGSDAALTDDEREDSEKCRAIAVDVYLEWMSKTPPCSNLLQIREERIWLRDDTGKELMSGQPDLVYIRGSSALILDFKTGFSRNLTPSDRNWQLRSLAVLVWKNYGCTNIRVGFVKPKAKRDPSDVTDYEPVALAESYRRIKAALDASASPDAPRRSGNHCSWCNARHICPEGASLSMLPSVIARVSSPAKKKDVVEAVQRLTPADWKYIWERGSTIRNILDSASTCLKALPSDQLKELGLKVNDGKRIQTVTDPQALFASLVADLPENVVWNCCAISKTKLIEAVMVERLVSKSEAEKFVMEKMKPYVAETRSEGSLEEI